jgi:hypothetical protein
VVPPTQRARWIARTLLLALPLTLLAGCSDDDGGGEPADFTVDITHEFWPMRPGTRWTYRESTEDEELTVVVTVTGVTKRIANGVTARVVRDTVTQGDQVVEDTFDWYAQDADGNVWYLGENTAEFEDGKLGTRAGSFEAGVDGAQAGIILPADPRPGLAYRQEYYEGEAEDTDALEPAVFENKYYAPGVDPVLAEDTEGGEDREELLEITQVDARAARLAGTTPLGATYP